MVLDSEIYLTSEHYFWTKMLTGTQVKVLLILLDDKGHAGWELAKYLQMENSNLNPILKKLESMGIIYQGEARKSRKPEKRKGDYKEFPYYLCNKLKGLKIMIQEIASGTKVWDTGFILQMTIKSNYIKSMRKEFREDLIKTIADELKENYPPYVDPRFKSLLQFLLENGLRAPFLEKDLEESVAVECRMETPMHSDLELWYHNYLRMRRSLKPVSTKTI
jgi:predicted transcriptional regulator